MRQEHLHLMGIPQWVEFCVEHDWPMFSYMSSPGVAKRLSGNGMHLAVVGAVWAFVLAHLERV